jgi:hypothetical protein
MSNDLASPIKLPDGHTTLAEAVAHAKEMHTLAEEFADECSDSDAAVVSKGAAIIEMMAAELTRVCTIADGLLNHCDKDGGECHVCSEICCPLKDPLHFHHDGCPSCSQEPRNG